MSDLLITNVDVLTNEGVLKNHAIAIENGYITAILKDSEVQEAYQNFNIGAFPIHWRLFYYFNKKKMVVLSFTMVMIIDFLRKRV